MSRERVSWIAHTGLDVQDPIPSEALARVVEACPLGADDLAVDIGCGSGELLARLHARWQCGGVGIDMSELAIAKARRRLPDLTWRVGDGRAHGISPGSATLVASIGATQVFGTLVDTLAAIAPLLRADAYVVIGDGYWRTNPSDTWLAALGAERSELGDRDALLNAIATAGFAVELTVDASPADMDAYNDAWRGNLERHLEREPDDPDAVEMRAALEHARRWHPDCGRYLGFAVVVARQEHS